MTKTTKKNLTRRAKPKHAPVWWVALAAVVALGLGVMAGTMASNHLAAARSSYTFQLLNARTSIVPDPAFTLADDQRFLIIDLKVSNNTAQPYNFFPSTQTYIKDAVGHTYQMHPSVMLASPLPGGAVAGNHSSTSGELSYAIPRALKDAKLYVDPGWAGMQPAVFNLKGRL